jgi:lysophospholipase L1-like esterase
MQWHIAVRIVLMPVLIGQALILRRRIVKLPEARGAHSGSVGFGPDLRLLVLGDSSAAGVGVESHDEGLLGHILAGLQSDYTVHFDLVAETGARTQDALGWMHARPTLHYDVVVSALGVNDVTKRTTLRRFLALQRQLVSHLRNERRAQLVVVSGLPPVGDFPALPQPLRWILGQQAVRFDRALRTQFDGQHGITLLDFDMQLHDGVMSADGFHPNGEVYAHWAAQALDAIKAHPPHLDAAPTEA